jgi:hypothetical protein
MGEGESKDSSEVVLLSSAVRLLTVACYLFELWNCAWVK